MNELGLLSKAKHIASVSGRSITSGYLALNWDALGKADANGAFADFKTVVVKPILAFSDKRRRDPQDGAAQHRLSDLGEVASGV